MLLAAGPRPPFCWPPILPPTQWQPVRLPPLECTFSQSLTPASTAGLQLFSRQRGGNLTHGTPAAVCGATLRVSPAALLAGETVSYSLIPAVSSAGGTLARPWVGQSTTATRCTGTGVFGLGTQVGVERYAEGLALGDVDGDLDLLTSAQGGSQVGVQLNVGTAAPPRPPCRGRRPCAPARRGG